MAAVALAVAAPGLAFSGLAGWDRDDHQAALAAFLVTCDLYGDAGLCARGAEALASGRAREFFETCFTPVPLAEDVLFTGYHEPEFEGSLNPGGRFRYPVHRLVAEYAGDASRPGPARAELQGLLDGQEIGWLTDPLDAFLLQIQGSGRLRLADGGVLRLGYAGRNGHAYRSIGKVLIETGEVAAAKMSVPAIRAWAAAHPDRVGWLLDQNPSYVFFREIAFDGMGPPGAMGRPVTAGRTLAVDRHSVRLGAPVWAEIAEGVQPMQRLMVAQDTGSAIVGPRRADVFHGSGAQAADLAGRQKDMGRLVVLVPRGDAAGHRSEDGGANSAVAAEAGRTGGGC